MVTNATKTAATNSGRVAVIGSDEAVKEALNIIKKYESEKQD